MGLYTRISDAGQETTGSAWISAPFIIYFDHFCWISIVIYCHSRITDHRHATNFVRVQPADMNVCRHPIGKSKIKMSNIGV